MFVQGIVLFLILIAMVVILSAVRRLEKLNDCHELIVASHLEEPHNSKVNGPSFNE